MNPTDMAAITHILFDLGNTLIYFDGDWPAVFHHALTAAGRAAVAAGAPVEARPFSERLRGAFQNYYEQREQALVELTARYVVMRTLDDAGAGGQSNAVLDAILSAFYRVTQASWRTVGTAHDVLQSLKRDGYRMGILSNAAHDADVQDLVDQAALRPYMDFVLSSAAIGRRKPHSEAYQRALSSWGAAPGEVLMVGDTLEADILGARNNGLTGVWIRRYAVTKTGGSENDRITADFALDRLDELPGLLREKGL